MLCTSCRHDFTCIKRSTGQSVDNLYFVIVTDTLLKALFLVRFVLLRTDLMFSVPLVRPCQLDSLDCCISPVSWQVFLSDVLV